MFQFCSFLSSPYRNEYVMTKVKFNCLFLLTLICPQKTKNSRSVCPGFLCTLSPVVTLKKSRKVRPSGIFIYTSSRMNFFHFPKSNFPASEPELQDCTKNSPVYVTMIRIL